MKILRKCEKLSQLKLAKKMEVEPIILKAIEEGEYDLPVGELERLSSALNVQPYQLLALADVFARTRV